MTDPTTLQLIWFLLICILWIGYFVLEGFDFGVGMLLPFLARDERETRATIHTIGPRLGRQRGLADRRRRRDLRRLPGVVRDALLRLLHRAVRDPRGADHRGVGVRVLGQGRRRRPGAGAGCGRSSWAARCRRCCGASPGRTSSRGVPLDADAEYDGTLFDLLNPYGLLGGVTIADAVPRARRDLPGAADDGRAGGARALRFARCWRRSRRPCWSLFLVWTLACRNGSRSCSAVLRRGRRGRRRRVRSPRGRAGRAFALSAVAIVARLLGAVRGPVPGTRSSRADPAVAEPVRRRLVQLHADGHDRGRGDLRPDRAALPGLDVLGLPRAAGRGGLRRRSQKLPAREAASTHGCCGRAGPRGRTGRRVRLAAVRRGGDRRAGGAAGAPAVAGALRRLAVRRSGVLVALALVVVGARARRRGVRRRRALRGGARDERPARAARRAVPACGGRMGWTRRGSASCRRWRCRASTPSSRTSRASCRSSR